MNEIEIIIGFQLRVSPESLPAWTQERRNKFLLSPNIKLPLGVDRSVWPLIETGEHLRGLFNDYIGDPLNSLHVFLEPSIDRINQCSQGAVVVLTAAAAEARELRKWGGVDNTAFDLPALRARGFTRLGFDVASKDACWSVLNDTDPGEAGHALLSAQFGALLNPEVGLFTEWESADRYRKAWDEITGWKGSQAVFGIWSKPLTTDSGGKSK